MCNLSLIQILNLLLLFGKATLESEKSWTYDLKSATSKSSNSDLVNFNIEVERVSRGVFALSGDFLFNIDIAEGDENEVEVKSYRKTHGDTDYKTLPFEMSRRHFYDALNTCYKGAIMESFKDCSDLPYFEDQAPVPFEKKTYVLNKCKFAEEGFPSHLESGEYKFVVSGYGEVEYELELIVEIEQNN